MAGVSDDQATSICGHCERAIPLANIDLHFVHCSRNLEKCKICGDMIPRKHAEEHFLSTHAPVSCSLCSEIMDRDMLEVHQIEICPKRIEICEYCEFPLPAIDLLEHQEFCGNRTDACYMCNKYVRLREKRRHESRCGVLNNSLTNSSESSRSNRTPETVPGTPRRQPREFSPRRLLFTIAITGIAVLLGSLFFQRKPDPTPVN